MTPHSNRIAQTSTEAKKLHKKNGPRLSEHQKRQLERAAELERRAARIREQEDRKKAAKKKREEKERKEREARKQLGVGLATQMIGYSHTQAQLKSGMESFLGLKKREAEEKRKKDQEMSRNLEALVEEVAKEPWDDEESENTFDLPELNASLGEQWIDEDLDDDTLLQLHDSVASDPVEEAISADTVLQSRSKPTIYLEPSKSQSSKEDLEFVRMHGPVNKAIESILDKLPQPLIELLSQDISIDPASWDPAPALLHKLNPVGLPPHRLRLKIGCVVTLLRELNSSSQLSKSQHLQVLRSEKERLECLVLDGQLEGTKAFLTRVAFAAKYRNDEKFPFQRIQFPIQVSKDFLTPSVHREAPRSTFKLPSISGQPSRSTDIPKKPSPSISKAKPPLPSNPSFKLPGMPASKAKQLATPRPVESLPASLLDGWDDFLDSGTQIARELSSEPLPPMKIMPPIHAVSSSSTSTSLPPLSTQDFDFTLEDLDDSPQLEPELPLDQVSRPMPSSRRHRPIPRYSHHRALNKSSVATIAAPSPQTSHQPPAKRKAAQKPPVDRPSPSKRLARQAAAPTAPAGKVNIPMKPVPSFHEFGISTQEAVSFFDDDEDIFGSPPIAV